MLLPSQYNQFYKIDYIITIQYNTIQIELITN
jgi:hypothetical protein